MLPTACARPRQPASPPSRCGARPAPKRHLQGPPALKAALEETGVQLTAQLAEPRTQFMIPPWDHSEFYRKLDEGVEIAHFLGTPPHGGRQRHRIRRLEAAGAAGQAHRDLPEGHRADRGLGHHARPRAGQRARRPPGFAAGPHRAKASTSPGASTRRSSACSTTSTTRPSRARTWPPSSRTPAIIKYVQLADAPGRGEPGTGSIDWPARLTDLGDSGYDGPIGLEYYPTTESAESVRLIQELAAGW